MVEAALSPPAVFSTASSGEVKGCRPGRCKVPTLYSLCHFISPAPASRRLLASWTQLGIHAKPCGILDAAGFFGPLRALVDGAVTAGFVHPAHRDMIVVDDGPARLLDRLAAWTPVTVNKLLDRSDR